MQAASMTSDRAGWRDSEDLRYASPTPALEAEPGSLSERVGKRLAGHHPVIVFLGGIVLSYVVLALVTLGVGVVFTETVLKVGGLDEADSRAVEWLAERRSSTLNDLSFFGSEMSGGIVLPIIVVLLGIGFAIRRHWRAAAFALFSVAVESATYRTTVLFVDRERPDVPRLDDLPLMRASPRGMSPRPLPSTVDLRFSSPLV